MLSSQFTQLFKKKESSFGQLSIDSRFFIKAALANYGQYTLFQGVDKQKMQWVHIYSKKADSTFALSSGLKETSRNQICPKVLWSGPVQYGKVSCYCEVHEKLGPSLKTMFETIKGPLKEKQIIHLLLELVIDYLSKIKLIEKMSSVKMVCGQLDPETIVFDSSPSKTDLYLLNAFKLKKRNEVVKPLRYKFVSRGIHLGRGTTTKDDLESVCYILMDLFLCGRLFADKTQKQVQEIKLSSKIEEQAEGFPKSIIDFYQYIITLNLNDQINFFYWKNYFTKLISVDATLQPFSFLQSRGNRSAPSHITHETNQFQEDDQTQLTPAMKISKYDLRRKLKQET